MVKCAYCGANKKHVNLRDVSGRSIRVLNASADVSGQSYLRATIATIKTRHGFPTLLNLTDTYDWESTPYFGALHASVALGYADYTYKAVPAFRAPHGPPPETQSQTSGPTAMPS